ncbi:MAG: hypothetical protein GF388_07045 [Candidatus Aegiribacteria sp.]|nr:hypothetical protein [Candidatus Aegiribacteria sp.]MBD3294889.1 hypothetical protein [Candidatus Fermentibacteria bacterium]
MSLAYFNRDASIVHHGKEYSFTGEDYEELNRDSLYWHNPTDPSTWLCAATVQRAIINFGDELPRKKLIKLCAETLNISMQKLENYLDWNANYMAFHDGGSPEENHVYPRDEK